VPFLLASKVVTIPEFLAQRYGPAVRQTFAFVTVIANVVIFMAAVLYTGGLALHGFFGLADAGLHHSDWRVRGHMGGLWWLVSGRVDWRVYRHREVRRRFGRHCPGLLAVSGDGKTIIHGFWIVMAQSRAGRCLAQALEHVRTHLNCGLIATTDSPSFKDRTIR